MKERSWLWAIAVAGPLALSLTSPVAPAFTGIAQAGRLAAADPVVSTGGADKTLTFRQGTRWAECTVTADTPHWSKGGGSVIFKTRVSCRGEGIPFVSVHVKGSLQSAPGGTPGHCAFGPYVSVATSSESQTIAVNGGRATYYTPQPGGKKVRQSATYIGSTEARITSPLQSNLGRTGSNCNYVKVPA